MYHTPRYKYFQILLDETLSFKAQIAAVYSKALLNISRIRAIRPCLMVEMCKILTQSLVLSHLDNANSCYLGLPEKELHKLQRIQNEAVKLIFYADRRDSNTDCLCSLHWLPVKQRIQYIGFDSDVQRPAW